MKKILVTGSAGFIGSHLVRYLLKHTDWDIISLDRYDTSGNLNRLANFIDEEEKKRIKVVFHDLRAEINDFTTKALGEVDYIVHMAASSHVDRSIEDPVSFVMDNVVGTTNLLNWARKGGLKKDGKLINFSTDEVFGPAPDGYAHKENDPHHPSNPYSASKSGQEAIGYAFFITYGLPVITTHTMNNFGETQHPEKLVPRTIRNVIEGKPMPIFARVNEDGKLEATGSRFWIHATNTASATLFLLKNGVAGEKYNIIGFDELTNLEIAEKIAAIVGKPLIPEFVDFYKVRPGHDRRYALDGTKMKEMGWAPEVDFDSSLKATVEWTVKHAEWQ
jgi:dTDP-glucose 4,6-dehydratase